MRRSADVQSCNVQPRVHAGQHALGHDAPLRDGPAEARAVADRAPALGKAPLVDHVHALRQVGREPLGRDALSVAIGSRAQDEGRVPVAVAVQWAVLLFPSVPAHLAHGRVARDWRRGLERVPRRTRPRHQAVALHLHCDRQAEQRERHAQAVYNEPQPRRAQADAGERSERGEQREPSAQHLLRRRSLVAASRAAHTHRKRT